MKEHYDFTIIGGGIIGASTAMQLAKHFPNKSILLLEKESAVAMHQTGHNSGVIHAGVYYPVGSLKADFCKRGLYETIAFCKQHNIPYEQCGKLIVATHEHELERLEKLFANSELNGLKVKWISQAKLAELEPNVNGIKAFLVEDSAITDYPAITEKMISEFEAHGGEVRLNSNVTALSETKDNIIIRLSTAQIKTDFLIACAGLQADRVTRMIGLPTDFKIIPFKGEYFKLPNNKSDIVNHLIYPVPDPEMPFLGVHLTKMIDGTTTVGPNAVLGLKREGYNRFNIDIVDISQMVFFTGFWRLISSNIGSGMSELKNSLWKRGYLKLINRYCDSVELKDLKPHPHGVRAQAVSKNGEIVHDFLFANSKRSLHVCNAPSPAATSAIPIGEHIVSKVIEATK